MSDPVFGISYDVSKVHFEFAPASISRLCSGFGGKRAWLYAHWHEAEADFYVLSNRETEVSGAGIVIQGGRCIEGLPDWVLSGRGQYRGQKSDENIQFSESVLHGLARDLLRRYVVAFGGKSKFLDRVRADGVPAKDLLPVVRTEFERFVGYGQGAPLDRTPVYPAKM